MCFFLPICCCFFVVSLKCFKLFSLVLSFRHIFMSKHTLSRGEKCSRRYFLASSSYNDQWHIGNASILSFGILTGEYVIFFVSSPSPLDLKSLTLIRFVPCLWVC